MESIINMDWISVPLVPHARGCLQDEGFPAGSKPRKACPTNLYNGKRVWTTLQPYELSRRQRLPTVMKGRNQRKSHGVCIHHS